MNKAKEKNEVMILCSKECGEKRLLNMTFYTLYKDKIVKKEDE